MEPERFEEAAIRWLLGELSPEESAAFEADRAREGPRGEEVIARLRESLGALALAARPVEPPAGLRERVLADARTVADTGVVPFRRPASRPWAAVAAVLAAIAVGMAAWSFALRRDGARLRAELEAARARLAVADSSAEATRRELAVLAAPDARTVALSGTEAQPLARARVFIDPVSGRALLYAYDLPILPPDAVYELWAIRGATPRPAGTFLADERGRARLEVADPGLLEGLDAFAVTIEPAPGVAQPTGEMVLVSGS